MKICNWLVSLLLVGALMSCSSETQVDLLSLSLDNYKPVDEFVDAYEAISSQPGLQSGRDYDLEKTVRVLNALELAQVRSESFDEFLDYMARQDYTGVAPDVLEAKRKLFPVLEYTYKLREQDEQLSDAWMLMRGAARGGETLVRNTSTSTLLRAAFGDMFAVLGIANGEDAERSTNEAFAQYERDKKLKSQLREDLQKLRVSYRQYLEDYTPIYKKYMQEYDALCIEKDKAYLDLYAGRTEEALSHTQSILQKYPDNPEALLLNAMALIMTSVHDSRFMVHGEGFFAEQSGRAERKVQGSRLMVNDSAISHQPSDIFPDSVVPDSVIPGVERASALLARYATRYPSRTAPALVLEGLMYQKMGDEQGAMSRFHQASVEYPRQAAQLTDMLDSYNRRNYLTRTPEGQYLRRLYASTMEGYGLFSPNLLKAKYYADKGQLDKSREEIYNHFFRRGNQGIYDELLSDMQFCEENLYGAFKGLLLESSYIDVSIEPESEWLFWDSDDVMRVKINNRSDLDLENVRVFLCIHYTDMYKDEYDVIKVPHTANIIAKHSTADLDTVVLRYPGKTYKDITRIRAIAMTDDRICWVDDVNYKQSHVLSFLRGGRTDVSQQQKQAREEYLRNYSLEPQKLQRTLREGITVLPPEEDPTVEKSWWDSFLSWFSSPDNDLKLELPRVLAMTDPVFSLYPLDSEEAITPEDNYLSGTSIHLHFPYVPAYGDRLPLYIYSESATFLVDILYKGASSQVLSVTIL
jgi:tetratricopeptide (TPR) repeat protein